MWDLLEGFHLRQLRDLVKEFMYSYGVYVGRYSSESGDWQLRRKMDGKQGRVGTNWNCKDGLKPSKMNWNPHGSHTASKSPTSVGWMTHKASGTLHHQAEAPRPKWERQKEGTWRYQEELWHGCDLTPRWVSRWEALRGLHQHLQGCRALPQPSECRRNVLDSLPF